MHGGFSELWVTHDLKWCINSVTRVKEYFATAIENVISNMSRENISVKIIHTVLEFLNTIHRYFAILTFNFHFKN